MSDWLDGPKFIAWLEVEHGFRAYQHTNAIKRRATAWRAGDMASIWKADELLTYLGLHLTLIPDALWLAEPINDRYAKPAGRSNFPQELRREVIAKRAAGASPHILAIETGVSERTIRKWTQKSKAKVEQ